MPGQGLKHPSPRGRGSPNTDPTFPTKKPCALTVGLAEPDQAAILSCWLICGQDSKPQGAGGNPVVDLPELNHEAEQRSLDYGCVLDSSRDVRRIKR